VQHALFPPTTQQQAATPGIWDWVTIRKTSFDDLLDQKTLPFNFPKFV
jgi:hypothetical protein